MKVLETADRLFHIGLDYESFDFGAERYLKTGQAVPDAIDTFVQALPERFDTALFGAAGTDPRVPQNAQRNFCYFEPVHGTGPDIIGQQRANPLAAIRAAGMLLAHFGHRDAAYAIEAAAADVIKSGKVTRDLSGSLSTPQAGEAVR